jgi:hypothetical protein
MRNKVVTIIAAILVGCFTASSAQQRKASGTLTAATPMSCRIEGKILRILKTKDNDKKSPCYKYGCTARVKLISVEDCGGSVTAPLNEGDTVTMKFAYTLHSTAKIFPSMKAQYPGLKKGNTFTANAEQRLQMGKEPEYTIYGYKVK